MDSNKEQRPEAFGVYKPVGHVVIAYEDEARLERAAGVLSRLGFEPRDLERVSPERMRAQADADVANATPLSSLGQELNLVKAHRELAARGCHFLIVDAPDDTRLDRVREALQAEPAVVAQRYGRFIIEELETTEGPQVFESPARGLDVESAQNEAPPN
ncbi:hypothetical protein ABXN37_21475 [Piscinibacter sakaiensis]|uniref:Uncharacterized protein n=1 Tax=Piscinibacter sakaiensis TaxID=1547922 RepID=A0A0K8P4W1_PISS1|nr:hypothetical protein [Piscinibacter sakaiensis]GAP37697.1 hypothetical protein ISF6_3642 [Piscinibacter sakaiensis]